MLLWRNESKPFIQKKKILKANGKWISLLLYMLKKETAFFTYNNKKLKIKKPELLNVLERVNTHTDVYYIFYRTIYINHINFSWYNLNYRKWSPTSVNFAAILTHFSFGSFLNIKHPHFDHRLLEIKEKHSLVNGVTIHNGSCSGRCVQHLIREKNPIFPGQCVEVIIIESVRRGIERLLCIVAGAASFW